MRYMGGKVRQSKAIVSTLVNFYNEQKCYYEPFMGALGAAEKVIPALYKCGVENFKLSDNSPALITLWRAVVYEGWIPPDTVDQSTYDHYKTNRDPNDPMTAYCGYAMSFGGKWFGGLARNHNTNRMQYNQKRATLRKAEIVRSYGAEIIKSDYKHITPTNAIVYCDPPYSGRTKAHDVNGFDAQNFWSWAAFYSYYNLLVVSEFDAPEEWHPVYSWGNTVVTHHLGDKNTKTDERLWMYNNN